ncbi:alkaline phosphatase D family protein [Arenimonas composti]|uniref:PhoD-like phosphatase metallophosphatase domain-containing protein n=1 Tax=Arenimonas composti TR7-09 = DSM 18010 TaxID=1121013 RepID=A0A091BCL7_9GAMM|nr:alkaline phosphatase D family protein [Arenimonas composti]KFN49451.1 hypothetical protein P873_10790 [Arenimonas composti TR7-09 = DSM 18010]
MTENEAIDDAVDRRRRGLLLTALASAIAGALPGRSGAAPLGYPRALQGPMLGAPGPNHLSVWVRASGAFEVELQVARDRDFRDQVATARGETTHADRGCIVLRADGLEPDTEYFYRLRFAGLEDRHQAHPFRARTAPAGPANFRVAFGSCCRIEYDPDQRIWNAVRQLEPDVFFWLGDNIYADSDDPDAMADLYARGRIVERIEPLLRSVPQLATWDDHDFGFNDSDGTGPHKDGALEVFRQFWANPSYGEPDNPGVYFRQHYGGVDFFVLDGRYHRDPSRRPDTPAKTMLGARQKAWLKRELRASTAPFKVLAIGGGWSCAENESGGDSWGVYLSERDEIFDFIRDAGIEGVVCISGDSHMGELNCIPRSEQGGYDLYDFCSSPLAQAPAAKNVRQVPEMRIRDTWTRSANVGLLRFDMTGPVPTLTYTLHDTLAKPVWAPLVLTPADLRNGVRSWDRLIDPLEHERLRNFRAGKGYYGFEPEEGWPNRRYRGEE